MPSNDDLDKMTVAASTLGWGHPADWPKSFPRDGRTWVLDHITTATETGEVQCAEYVSGQDWLIVYNE